MTIVIEILAATFAAGLCMLWLWALQTACDRVEEELEQS